MTASIVMVDFLLGQNNLCRPCKAKQWHASLINVREIMTNIINLGRFNKPIIRLIDYCLTSIVQYFSYIQAENKFNI